jgi:hypothetical protein
MRRRAAMALAVVVAVGWLGAAAAAQAPAAAPSARGDAKAPAEVECSVPDPPEVVAERERKRRDEDFTALTSMTIGVAWLSAEVHWEQQEHELLAELARQTEGSFAEPGTPGASAGPKGSLREDRLVGIAESCRVLAGSDPAACSRWTGESNDVCRGWLATRSVAKHDLAACAAVAREFRAMCVVRARAGEAPCDGLRGPALATCRGIAAAVGHDWSRPCEGMHADECIGLVSALSAVEGLAACDRLPAAGAGDAGAASELPSLSRQTCQAVVGGKPELCPGVAEAAEPSGRSAHAVAARVLGRRDGPHLALAAAAAVPSICFAVTVVRESGKVVAVESDVLRADLLRTLRVSRPIRRELDPFAAEVSVDAVCAPVMTWQAAGHGEDP